MPGGGAVPTIPTTTTPRGPTTKSLLQMKWDYPVYRDSTPKSDATTVKLRKALSFDEALRYVSGSDPRPLLVLRECKTCNKTDNALLKAGASDNEKTILYSRWFHCVKLPVDVIQDDHPFNALFKDNNAPHFFVATRDGHNVSSKIRHSGGEDRAICAKIGDRDLAVDRPAQRAPGISKRRDAHASPKRD